MKKNLPLIFLMLAARLFAQDCNCSESYKWMVKTFEKNDAGFQYILDKKGKKAYENHSELFAARAKNVSNTDTCHSLLNEWLRFFRSGHIGVSLKPTGNNRKEPGAEEIRAKYKNEPKILITESEFVSGYNSRKKHDHIEGIWSNGAYKIAVVKDEKIPGKFLGLVLKADSVYWMPGQIKAEFNSQKINGPYKVTYYMRDHSKQNYTCSFADTNGAILSINGDYWKKEFPRVRLTGKEQLLIQFSKSRLPFLDKLSDSTLYLRIPSFAWDHKQYIDSVLKVYDKLIRNTPRLVIDIRNGTGGSDASYRELLPYIYTQPIRSVGIQLLATDMNAVAYEEYAKQMSDTADINYCKRIAKRMRANPGKFIKSEGEQVSIDSSYKVIPYPKSVVIICNKRNGSTDEQFLIDAKQSRKVKVYGHPTGGMLDISNMNFVDFPDKRFSLGYCMSKSYRIPDYCIDGVGIQPDVFIDNTIPESDWIEFVRREIER